MLLMILVKNLKKRHLILIFLKLLLINRNHLYLLDKGWQKQLIAVPYSPLETQVTPMLPLTIAAGSRFSNQYKILLCLTTLLS